MSSYLSSGGPSRRLAIDLAFEELRGYLTLVSARALPKRIRAKVGVSDIVQQTMLKAHQNADGYLGTSETELRAWLRIVVENTVRDAVRRHVEAEKRTVDREDSLEPGLLATLRAKQESPSSALAVRERDRRLLAAIEQLPERQRKVVEMRHSEQLAYEQIAERMGTTAQAARQLWTRAMHQLRTILEGDSAIE